MALEWLKTILGDAYSDDIDKKVSEEIGKGFVARADLEVFNSVQGYDHQNDTSRHRISQSDANIAWQESSPLLRRDNL